MKDKTITDSLYVYIQMEIYKIERKSNIYKVLFYFYKVIQILLAGAITIIAGMYIYTETIILILGAVITALTAIETLFQFEIKRSTYNAMLFELREIRFDIIILLLDKDDDIKKARLNSDDKNKIFRRYKDIKSLARTLFDNDKNDKDDNLNNQTTTA